MNQKRNIIIGVQGTAQLLSAITAVQYRERQFSNYENRYILVVYDLFSRERDPDFVNSIFKLSSIWNFDRKIFLDDIAIKKITRSFCSKVKKFNLLHEIVGLSKVDEIYLCRNYIGFGSSFILNSYPEAMRITYGDGYGTVSKQKFFENFSYQQIGFLQNLIHGLKRNFKRKLFDSLGWSFKTLEFDLALLAIAVDYCGGYLKSIPHEFIPLSVLEDVLDRARTIIKHEYSHYVESKINSERVDLLLLPSTLTESGYTSEEKEIELYLSGILPYLSEGDAIAIKAHPRSSSNVLKGLESKLLQLGFKVYVLSEQEFNFVPIELSISLINPKVAVSFGSSSPIVMSLFDDIQQICIHSEKLLIDCIFPGSVESMIDYQTILTESLESIKGGWFGGKVLWTRPISIS